MGGGEEQNGGKFMPREGKDVRSRGHRAGRVGRAVRARLLGGRGKNPFIKTAPLAPPQLTGDYCATNAGGQARAAKLERALRAGDDCPGGQGAQERGHGVQCLSCQVPQPGSVQCMSPQGQLPRAPGHAQPGADPSRAASPVHAAAHRMRRRAGACWWWRCRPCRPRRRRRRSWWCSLLCSGRHRPWCHPGTCRLHGAGGQGGGELAWQGQAWDVQGWGMRVAGSYGGHFMPHTPPVQTAAHTAWRCAAPRTAATGAEELSLGAGLHCVVASGRVLGVSIGVGHTAKSIGRTRHGRQEREGCTSPDLGHPAPKVVGATHRL